MSSFHSPPAATQRAHDRTRTVEAPRATGDARRAAISAASEAGTVERCATLRQRHPQQAEPVPPDRFVDSSRPRAADNVIGRAKELVVEDGSDPEAPDVSFVEERHAANRKLNMRATQCSFLSAGRGPAEPT